VTWLAQPWGIALSALGAVALLAFLLWAYVRATVRWLSRSPRYASVDVLRAPDGGRFELRRIACESAAGGAGRAAPPVLLVHGICANHRNLDLHDDNSLARHLASRGRDVWLLTLRSGRPWRLREACMPQGFEAMVRYDVPLAIEQVLERTGAAALDYVGFSMGGMLLYAGLGRGIDESAVRRAVVVGSPGRVQPPRGVPRLLRFVPRAVVPPILTGTFGTLAAPGSEWLTTPAHRAVVNPANVAPGMTRLALVDCVQDVSGSLLADFMRWATTDGVVRVAGSDVLDGLRNVAVPALFIAGDADQVAAVAAVREAYDAWGRDEIDVDKQWVVLGEASGAIQRYGHGDLAVGCRLRTELFPVVETFLAGRGAQTRRASTGDAARSRAVVTAGVG
jgi:pimeloyl-ACP methyl ester carboxylesterase